jgi:serine/threonine protein kinase, bacterial
MRSSYGWSRQVLTATLGTLIAAAGLTACQPTGTGAAPGTNPGPPPPPPSGFTPPAHEVLVASQGGNIITGHALDANGMVTAAPARVIGGSVLQNNTGLRGTFGLALGKADVIFAANHGDAGTAPSITVYAPDANGNVTPSTVITGPASGLSKPQGLVIRRNTDSILVANWVDPPAAGHDSAIIEFPVESADSVPTGGIGGSSTGIAAPGGVALDASSHVYVSESAANRILVFEPRPGTQHNQAPIRNIAGSNTLLNRPTGMAFDAQGNLYVVNLGNDSITVYAPTASGNAAPLRRLGGPGAANTRLQQPYGIALDSAGHMFVTQGNSFLVFAAGATGSQAPMQTVTDPHLNYTTGIAVR